MGECGCGNFSGDLTFPAPNGDVYVLDIYLGCEDCDAPAGVVLHRFTSKEAARWGVEDREPLEITQDGTGIPVMDAGILRRLLAKEVGATEDMGGCTPAEFFEQAIEDGMRNHFRDAAWKTYSQWDTRRRKAAAATPERAP